MKLLKQVVFVLVLSASSGVVVPTTIQAQCPMCRMTAEGNLKEGGSAGKGLNIGILYMLSMPYLIVASLGFVWYRNHKNALKDEVEIK